MGDYYSPTALQARAVLERKRREKSGVRVLSQYEIFKKKYFNDPAGFVRDCIAFRNGNELAEYQGRALALLPDRRRVSVRGPHGLGKSALMSFAILWFALTRDGLDWKIPITASVWRQLTKYLLPELHKWARRLRWDIIGRPPFSDRELLVENLKLSTGEAFSLASSHPEFIEGAHADYMLYIFDESKSIVDAMWDSAEGAFSAGECYWLACSTPGEPTGRFYDIQSRAPGFDDWEVMHVTKGEAIAAGRMSPEWAESRRRQWGETSPVYQNRVEGNFADAATDGVIPLAWIEAANERYLAWQDAGFPGVFTGLGSDVGGDGPGNDRSTIAIALDYTKILEIRVGGVGDPYLSTMNLVGQIGGIIDKMTRDYSAARSHIPAIIDVIGIGAGVTHRLRELGFNACAFNAGKSTPLRDKTDELGFFDWRAAGWWILREMLEPNSGFDICLPPDTDETNLTGDLIAPTYTVTSDSLIRVESKDLIRRRIKRSTDYADAVIQALVGPILIEVEAKEQNSEVVFHYNPPQIRG